MICIRNKPYTTLMEGIKAYVNKQAYKHSRNIALRIVVSQRNAIPFQLLWRCRLQSLKPYNMRAARSMIQHDAPIFWPET
jgi:hypothetical protein